MVGAACAYYARAAGLSVALVDRGHVAGGTTGAGEGNLLVSDKEPGPELELALLSLRLWHGLAAEFPGVLEYEPKGGLVVASSPDEMRNLRTLAAGQAGHGVAAEEVPPERLREIETHLADGLPGGMFYSQDAQVQPALAAARLLGAARRAGADVLLGAEVTGMVLDPDGAVRGLRTDRNGVLGCHAVVNAAGTWAAGSPNSPEWNCRCCRGAVSSW